MSNDETCGKMESLFVFRPPISASDLESIESMLRTEQVFCTSFPDRDAYSLVLYYGEAEIHQTRARILVDRNIFARIVALAAGTKASPDHRIAAAVMAFAQCADIEIEPALAAMEGAATQAKKQALHDLGLFYAADNLNPSEYADIALGRIQKVRTRPPPFQSHVDWAALTKPFKHYSFVYPLVLQIGTIELNGGPMAMRMRKFLDWTYDNWYFSAPATLFAALCFSGSPPRDALKYLREPNRSKALDGLRNCAWDLAYVTWWGELLKRQDQENRLYIFCSLDKTLRRVAGSLLAEPEATDAEIAKTLRGILGIPIYDHYLRLIARKDDPARPANRIGPRC